MFSKVTEKKRVDNEMVFFCKVKNLKVFAFNIITLALNISI